MAGWILRKKREEKNVDEGGYFKGIHPILNFGRKKFRQ